MMAHSAWLPGTDRPNISESMTHGTFTQVAYLWRSIEQLNRVIVPGRKLE